MFTRSHTPRLNCYFIFLVMVAQFLFCLEASGLAPAPEFLNGTDASPFGAFAATHAQDAGFSTLARNPLERRQGRTCPYGPAASRCRNSTVI